MSVFFFFIACRIFFLQLEVEVFPLALLNETFITSNKIFQKPTGSLVLAKPYYASLFFTFLDIFSIVHVKSEKKTNGTSKKPSSLVLKRRVGLIFAGKFPSDRASAAA